MKKPHYYYKVSAESHVGRDIQAFMTRCQEAEEQALEWAKKQGAEHYYESPEGMAGGVGDEHKRDKAGIDSQVDRDLLVLGGGHGNWYIALQ